MSAFTCDPASGGIIFRDGCYERKQHRLLRPGPEEKRFLERYNGLKLGWLQDSIHFIVLVAAVFALFRLGVGFSVVGGDSMLEDLSNTMGAFDRWTLLPLACQLALAAAGLRGNGKRCRRKLSKSDRKGDWAAGLRPPRRDAFPIFCMNNRRISAFFPD